jgi:threonine dehydrogenase-like Zn-dependent dehydrogenase
VRVPFADNTCLPIPDDVPDEKALYLTDVLCTSLHATELVCATMRREERISHIKQCNKTAPILHPF